MGAGAPSARRLPCSCYLHRMPRRGVSVTLDSDNLLWLRAQAGPGRSVSRIVDDLVGEARARGRRADAAPRSVAGTIDLGDFNPEAADLDLRTLFDVSLGGSAAVHERRARYARKRPAGRRGSGGA